MSPKTREALQAFAGEMHWSRAGLPEDQDRFYDFVVNAYRNGDRTIEQDAFIEAINSLDANRDADMPLEKKRQIMQAKLYTYNKYEDGMKLLGRFEK